MSRRKPPGTPAGGEFAEEPRDEAEVALSADSEPCDRVTRTLREFLHFADQGARLVARGKTAYDQDEMLRLAGEALLHKISEAVARLDRDDPALVAAHPEVNSRAMKGIRNLVAHDYGAVDYEIVWAALEGNLPREAAHIGRILDARDG